MENRYFRCVENGEIFSISQLLSDFEGFCAESPDEYAGMTFGRYLNNCMTENNGSLDEVRVLRLWRYGSYWKNDHHKIRAVWDTEDGEEDGYFLVDGDGRRLYPFDRISDDEMLVYAEI